MAAIWPLTGRADELTVISGELIRHGDGSAGVVLAGAAGVGKTRLAREALRLAAQRGALTRWVVATASARILPLGAFATTLGEVGADPARLMRQASEALLAGAGKAGVVIGVDDAHLLDELSATLVHRLVLRRAASVVLTLRTGEAAPDSVTALWKDGHLTRLEVQPLSQDETTELLEARLCGPLDFAAAHRLWFITQGNALYLRQLVDGELEAGRLHQISGVWRWVGNLELSPGLLELLLIRIGQLSESLRDVVEILAFGEPLGVPLLIKLTDGVAVEQAEAQSLVEVYSDGRRLEARLAHPLYGEVQRRRMGTLRARQLCGRLASALANTGERRASDTLRRALLTLDSDLSADPVLLTRAALRSTELGDLALAEQLTRTAVAIGGGFEPRLLLGNALHWLGRATEAETELAALAALARTDAERVQAAIPRSANLVFGLGRSADADAMFNNIMSTISDDVAALELSAMRSVLDAFRGRTEQAADAATVVLADPRCPPPATQLATWGLTAVRGSQGRLDGIEERVRWIDTRADAFEIGLHQAIIIGSSWVRGLILAGRLDLADHVSQHYRERCEDTAGLAYFFASAMSGAVALSRGQVQTAARLFAQSLTADMDTIKVAFTLMVDLPGAYGMGGDAISARAALQQLSPFEHHPGFEHLKPEFLLAVAWVTAAEGSVSEAITLTRRAADLAAAQQQSAVEVLALHTAVCFGDRTVSTRLATLATQIDEPRAAIAAAHATALATNDGAKLHICSVQLEQIGALLLAADAAAQAATAHTHHDRRGSAQAATARAHRLAQTCEGAHTPALAALSVPAPLTCREQEIVTLAAHGLSNRQIAERLVVSVRTIEGHLYRACAKLGASNRTELAALIRGD